GCRGRNGDRLGDRGRRQGDRQQQHVECQSSEAVWAHAHLPLAASCCKELATGARLLHPTQCAARARSKNINARYETTTLCTGVAERGASSVAACDAAVGAPSATYPGSFARRKLGEQPKLS